MVAVPERLVLGRWLRWGLRVGCLSVLLTAAPAQDQAPDAVQVPTAEQLTARLQKLDAEARATVVRNVEKRLLREQSHLVQNVLDRERGPSAYPAPAARVWFEPRDYAPVAAPRQLVAAGTAGHRAATGRCRPFEFLPDLQVAIVYDWALGKAVRVAPNLGPEARFANLVRGFFPHSDHAVAQVLEALDDDPDQRALGDYFEHLYGDRNGAVFAGVSLYDAWNSGIQLEMPDTDAIAFAVRILGTASFVSPIPEDRRRERLYGKLREAFERHRDHRVVRLAAAAAYVAGEPKLDATYLPLVARCQWVWQQVGWEPKEFAARLRQTPDRTQWLLAVDAEIRAAPEAVAPLRQAWRDWGVFLRQLAAAELARAGG